MHTGSGVHCGSSSTAASQSSVHESPEPLPEPLPDPLPTAAAAITSHGMQTQPTFLPFLPHEALARHALTASSVGGPRKHISRVVATPLPSGHFGLPSGPFGSLSHVTLSAGVTKHMSPAAAWPGSLPALPHAMKRWFKHLS